MAKWSTSIAYNNMFFTHHNWIFLHQLDCKLLIYLETTNKKIHQSHSIHVGSYGWVSSQTLSIAAKAVIRNGCISVACFSYSSASTLVKTSNANQVCSMRGLLIWNHDNICYLKPINSFLTLFKVDVYTRITLPIPVHTDRLILELHRN